MGWMPNRQIERDAEPHLERLGIDDETGGNVMRTQPEVEELIQRLFQEVGYNPSELIQIKPMDGGWENALSYEITRRDGKRTRIYRRDLDDGNESRMKNALRGFE